MRETPALLPRRVHLERAPAQPGPTPQRKGLVNISGRMNNGKSDKIWDGGKSDFLVTEVISKRICMAA
jgi:hypothetical protein